MFGLLVDKNWFMERWETEPRKRTRRRLPKYSARFLVCVLLIVGGAMLASNVSGGRTDPSPPARSAIRLM